MKLEYETRINEEETKFDEERQILQTQFQQLKFESQARIDKMERDLMLLKGEHENQAKVLEDKSNQIKSMEESQNERFDCIKKAFGDEKSELQTKID